MLEYKILLKILKDIIHIFQEQKMKKKSEKIVNYF